MILRLSFGLSVISELFHSTISQLISNILGLWWYFASVTEHDRTLDAVAKRLAESGPTLNKAKVSKIRLKFYSMDAFFLRVVYRWIRSEFDSLINSRRQHQPQKPLQYFECLYLRSDSYQISQLWQNLIKATALPNQVLFLNGQLWNNKVLTLCERSYAKTFLSYFVHRFIPYYFAMVQNMELQRH